MWISPKTSFFFPLILHIFKDAFKIDEHMYLARKCFHRPPHSYEINDLV